MEAKELRIGNWVIFDTDQNGKMYLPVTVIRIDQICSGFNISYYDAPTIEPIPLTPEILEKAGKKIRGRYDWFYFNSKSGRLRFYYSENRDLLFQSGGLRLNVKYLHQLQNLYFALTGEELKIEL